MPAPRSRYITERSAEMTGWTKMAFRMPRKMTERYSEPNTFRIVCWLALRKQIGALGRQGSCCHALTAFRSGKCRMQFCCPRLQTMRSRAGRGSVHIRAQLPQDGPEQDRHTSGEAEPGRIVLHANALSALSVA